MQLSKRTIIILSSVLAAAAIAAAVVWYKSHQEAQPQENVVLNEHPTDGAFYEYDTPSADSLIVGRWINTANPQWHKVYYDDYDEEAKMFWGKEWNEADDVQEEDLRYHGNGWFRWSKRGKELREFSTMDVKDMSIARIYILQRSSCDSLVYHERDYKRDIFRFAKEQ